MPKIKEGKFMHKILYRIGHGLAAKEGYSKVVMGSKLLLEKTENRGRGWHNKWGLNSSEIVPQL